ncbi:MAG TPA: hypothetical protein ENK56_00310 [Chloroflexi bacterium]|nr:hypothetical protein [Chloroflexota bacterium]
MLDRSLQGRDHRLGRLEAPIGVFGHRLQDHILHRPGKLRVELARWAQRLRQVLDDDGHRRLCLEGDVAGRHLVEHGTQRVDVCPSIHGQPLGLLRGHIVGSTQPHAGFGQIAGGLQDLGQSEIGEQRPVALGDEDVPRLDIPMDDPMLMGVPQRVANLADDLVDGLQVERLPFEHIPQGAGLDILHHQVGQVSLAVEVVNGEDVGVVQSGDSLGLPGETLQEARVFGEIGGENLDGDKAV